MGLKAKVKDINEVDEKYRDLYIERGGEWVLDQIDGMKTDADVSRVQTALTQERTAHKETKLKLEKFGDLNPDEIHEKMDKLTELEAKGSGNSANEEERIEKIVQARLSTKLGPVERELRKANEKAATFEAENTELKTRERRSKIESAVRSAATEAKILPDAIEDAILLSERIFDVDDTGSVISKDGVGVTPGVAPQVWLTEIQSKRPHWWPTSVGGGAKDIKNQGGRTNPWSKDNWNLTEQGKIYNENKSLADQMAKSAGTTVGGLKPVK